MPRERGVQRINCRNWTRVGPLRPAACLPVSFCRGSAWSEAADRRQRRARTVLCPKTGSPRHRRLSPFRRTTYSPSWHTHRSSPRLWMSQPCTQTPQASQRPRLPRRLWWRWKIFWGCPCLPRLPRLCILAPWDCPTCARMRGDRRKRRACRGPFAVAKRQTVTRIE